jgi:hypothetical protein
VYHLVKDKDIAVVVKGHVLDSETQSHIVVVVNRITVCHASEIVSYDRLIKDLTVIRN